MLAISISSTLIWKIFFSTRTIVRSLAIVIGAIPEMLKSVPMPCWILLIFHRLWWEPWFCHPGRILEPWRCVKGPCQNNLQPVLQPHWKFEFCIHTYRNQAFSISGQTLSHGDVSQDQFWKICLLSKHPSGNFEFPCIRIEYILFWFRTALRSVTRCQGDPSRTTEVGPEAMLDFIDFHTLW